MDHQVEPKHEMLQLVCSRTTRYATVIGAMLLASQLLSHGGYPLMMTTAETLSQHPAFSAFARAFYGLSQYSAQWQFPRNDVRRAVTFCGLASVEIQRDDTGDLDRAIGHVRQALNIYTSMFGPNSAGANNCLTYLAAAYKLKGDTANALKYELRELKSCQEMYGEAHVSAASKLEDIADIYRESKNLDMSVEFQDRSLKMKQKIWGDSSRYTVQDLLEVADGYNKLGAPRLALQMYMKALAVAKAQPDANNDPTARIQDKIAAWYYEHHDYEEALTWYSKEHAARSRKIMATDGVDWRSDHERIGRCLVQLGQYSRALKEFKLAKADWKRDETTASPQIEARLCYWLGRVYEGLNQNDKAASEYEAAEKALLKTDDYEIDMLDGASLSGAVIRYGHARFLERLGKTDDLIARLERVLKQTDEDAQRTQTLQLLYTVQARGGKWKEAIESHERYMDSLITAREQVLRDKTVLDFRRLRATGEQRMQQQDVSGAIDVLAKAARLGEQLIEVDERELCQVLTYLAAAEIRVEKYAEAEAHLLQARKLATQEFQRNHGRADSAYTLANTDWLIAADLMMTSGKFQQAAPYFESALKQLRLLPAHRQDTFVCLNDYAACCRLVGNEEKAAALEKEAAQIDQGIAYDIHNAGECVALYSGQKTFRLQPSRVAEEAILAGPLTLTEALYTKTLGDEQRSRGNLAGARDLYSRALNYLRVLTLDQTVYAAPVKHALAEMQKAK